MLKISIIILAAGASSRMGETKQLLPYKKSTLLQHAISQGLASNADNVCCVLGAKADTIKNHLKTSKVTFIDNSNWGKGLSTSVVAGITYIQSLKYKPDAVLIMLSDQPFIDSDFINVLIEKFEDNPDAVIASDYGNKNGVPAIFPKTSFEFLLNLKGDKGAKMFLNNNVFKTIKIKPRNENALKDIDTPSDYNSLLN